MIPAAQVAKWWRDVAEHPRRWCPTCQRRHCWVQAEARGQLIVHGLWNLGPPPTDDRSHEATGEARRTA